MTTQSREASAPGAESSAPGAELMSTLVAELQHLQANRRMPPVQQWQPSRVGQIDIRIAADGQWHHEGRPILRKSMVQLFASVLRRDDDLYYLVTPAEKLLIRVEDVPFVGVILTRAGQGDEQRLVITTNVDDHVTLDAEHPLWMQARNGQQVPYIEVRAGLHARVARAVFYELAELAEDLDGEAVVTSCGAAFSLGTVR